jgi:DNA-binding CsgD family transcriptional regulator
LPATLPVVVLLNTPEPSAILEAITAGATGAIHWTASETELLRAIDAAMAGLAILPVELIRALAPGSEVWLLSEEETMCIRSIASGETVSSLAETIHYSERETFRRLKNLYRRLGATGRDEAIARAAKLGLLDPGLEVSATRPCEADNRTSLLPDIRQDLQTELSWRAGRCTGLMVERSQPNQGPDVHRR